MEFSKFDAEVLDRSCEIIKDRLYFTSHLVISRKSTHVHYFCVDDEFVYANFFADFGPLNLAMLYRYCFKVNKKLKVISSCKKIVHCTQSDAQKKVNAAFLIGSYAVIYLKMSPEEVHHLLTLKCGPSFLSFRDASLGASTYNLTLLDCLRAVKKALECGFFDYEKFNIDEYEYYEKVENGDLNWIIPNKFLAFAGPHSKAKIENGYPLHAPEMYIPYFCQHNVSTVIRLNKKMYNASRFRQANLDHFDLFFTDGSTPGDPILRQFLEICENAKGAIAVHCKAGLGRTGTLIGCYLMKHYEFTAAEAIAWLRIARPGSVIGPQQNYLEEKQSAMSKKDSAFWVNTNERSDYQQMLSSAVDEMRIEDQGEMTTPMSNNNSRDCLNLENSGAVKEGSSGLTQGDHLNRIKSRRGKYSRRSMTRCNDQKEQIEQTVKSDSSPSLSNHVASPSKPLTATDSREKGLMVKKRNLPLQSTSVGHSPGKRKKSSFATLTKIGSQKL